MVKGFLNNTIEKCGSRNKKGKYTPVVTTHTETGHQSSKISYFSVSRSLSQYVHAPRPFFTTVPRIVICQCNMYRCYAGVLARFLLRTVLCWKALPTPATAYVSFELVLQAPSKSKMTRFSAEGILIYAIQISFKATASQTKW